MAHENEIAKSQHLDETLEIGNIILAAVGWR
jgi:hypothetical protein